MSVSEPFSLAASSQMSKPKIVVMGTCADVVSALHFESFGAVSGLEGGGAQAEQGEQQYEKVF
jgi:hypothetical protein